METNVVVNLSEHGLDFKVITKSVRDYLALMSSGMVDANASFQRGDVASWDSAKKLADFNESIVTGRFIPPILYYIDESGKTVLIDGKQRSRALRNIHLQLGITCPLEDDFYNRQLLFVEVSSDIEEVVHLFYLLNRGGVALSPMQARRAEYVNLIADSLKLDWGVSGLKNNEVEAVILLINGVRRGVFEVSKFVDTVKDGFDAERVNKAIALCLDLIGMVDDAKKYNDLMSVDGSVTDKLYYGNRRVEIGKWLKRRIHFGNMAAVFLLNDSIGVDNKDVFFKRLVEFANIGAGKDALKKSYSLACSSATGSSTSLVNRINLMAEFLGVHGLVKVDADAGKVDADAGKVDADAGKVDAVDAKIYRWGAFVGVKRVGQVAKCKSKERAVILLDDINVWNIKDDYKRWVKGGRAIQLLD